MGRKKKSIVEKSPFKLRQRKLADGRVSLFLDRVCEGKHDYEFLQLYLLPETSVKAQRENARTMRTVEEIIQKNRDIAYGECREYFTKYFRNTVVRFHWHTR